MSGTYSVIVVGMGKRGKHHAAAFQENDAFEVVGICDIDEGRLAEGKTLLGKDVAVSTDAAALVADLKPDVFCFCTMPHLRTPFIKMATDAGVKLVAFEKPVADSTAAAAAVKALIDDSGIKAVVSHQHRYGPHYTRVKEIVDSGALGNIHTITATSPGWMMHMMTHMIDYMSWYNNYAEADWVMAQAAGRSKLSDNHPSPDYIAGVIQFANGVRGIVETGAGAPNIAEVAKWWGRNRIRVMGDNGFAEVLTNGGWRSVTKDGSESGEGAMTYDADMRCYIQEMADWLRDDKQVHACNFERAYKGFEIMMALCRSAVDGGQVPLPLVGERHEIDDLRAKLDDRPVLLGHPDHAAEFGG
ncbi:MAG: Gfo/Idh/MocA family oxidoreductase [Verrucomicrobia bacterium]|nr:Gfo/Idh/MocA family oxidoreductase [Verrucomicrobiota bacterium]